jgi:hypothetical protein
LLEFINVAAHNFESTVISFKVFISSITSSIYKSRNRRQVMQKSGRRFSE